MILSFGKCTNGFFIKKSSSLTKRHKKFPRNIDWHWHTSCKRTVRSPCDSFSEFQLRKGEYVPQFTISVTYKTSQLLWELPGFER